MFSTIDALEMGQVTQNTEDLHPGSAKGRELWQKGFSDSSDQTWARCAEVNPEIRPGFAARFSGGIARLAARIVVESLWGPRLIGLVAGHIES